MLTRTIDHYREEQKETLVSTCKLFGVNRQVYYRRTRSTLKHQETATKVVGMVLDIRKQMPRIGTRKLYYLLEYPLRKLSVGRDKLFSILNANHLSIKPKRSYKTTTNSHHRFHKHKNLVDNMPLTRPEQLWVSDITYVGSRNKHNYLALVTDAYSKKVVGHDLSSSLGVDGTVRALKMAVKQRMYKDEQLIHHSDRGIQYCSDEYQKLLGKKQIKCSMTEKYDPYANAVAERVNGILKDEFQLEEYDVDTETMRELVKDSVNIYNTKRPHYSCFMLTPEQMHRQKTIKIRTYKKTDGIKASLDTIC
jgi:transposase InsO family protein